MARIIGGPRGQLWVDVDKREKRRLLAVDFPPLAHLMLVEGEPTAEAGVDVSVFTEYDVEKRTDVRFEDMPLGFTHKPWPVDYRTRGQMIADRETAERGD